jgi:hypothetical protein
MFKLSSIAQGFAQLLHETLGVTTITQDVGCLCHLFITMASMDIDLLL